MNDDYLWDGTGEPDPEVKRMETLLGRFRHRGAPIRLPDPASAPAPGIRWKLWIASLAAAATVVAILVGPRFARRHATPPVPPEAGWTVSRLSGAPRVESTVIDAAGKPAKLIVGQTLETDAGSRAVLTVDGTGEVQVDPETRIRLLGTASSRQRLALDRGTIHATIWASPGEFVVDTPSAVAVDLGCAYTLHVDDSGTGLLRTTLGWVGFTLDGRESFIPAGAACPMHPRTGPGTPYFEDASQRFRDALASLDAESSADERAADLAVVLSESRKRDALTLWHLLSRVGEPERGPVYDRLGLLVPPPPNVTRVGVLQLDRGMLDAWWNELDLGDISLWRNWERSWPEHHSGTSREIGR